MDYEKISKALKELRLQKNMTQRQLAEKLNLTEQAVSKWERGLGLPDISLCPILAEIFGVDVSVILTGNLEVTKEMTNNLKNLKFYICPECGNVITALSEINISCCNKIVPLSNMRKAEDDEKMTVEIIDDEYYITSNHPMTKNDYIAFTAFITGEKVEAIQHFPEWKLELHIPKYQHGKLIWYSKNKVLLYQLI